MINGKVSWGKWIGTLRARIQCFMIISIVTLIIQRRSWKALKRTLLRWKKAQQTRSMELSKFFPKFTIGGLLKSMLKRREPIKKILLIEMSEFLAIIFQLPRPITAYVKRPRDQWDPSTWLLSHSDESPKRHIVILAMRWQSQWSTHGGRHQTELMQSRWERSIIRSPGCINPLYLC